MHVKAVEQAQSNRIAVTKGGILAGLQITAGILLSRQLQIAVCIRYERISDC